MVAKLYGLLLVGVPPEQGFAEVALWFYTVPIT